MQRLIFVSVALLAVLSTSLAAPTEYAPILSLPQLPQIPSFPIPPENLNLNNLDNQARTQARAILDDVVSRYPSLIDGIASLLNTQSLLALPSSLQNLRAPDLPQSSPLLPLPQFPKLNDILPVTNIPPILSLPGLQGASGTPGSDASSPLSPLSSAVDIALANLRGFASSPLQLLPLRLGPPGGTPTSRGLQLPRTMVPLILRFPNEEGLSPEELAESIRKKLREQTQTPNDGSLNALVSLDPFDLTRVLDVQPLPPTRENVKKDSSKPIPVRRTELGPFSNGNTEVEIYWDNADPNIKPAKKRTDNVRVGMTGY